MIFKIVIKTGSKIELRSGSWGGESFKPNALEQDIITTVETALTMPDFSTFLFNLISKNITDNITFKLIKGETVDGKILSFSKYHTIIIKCKDILFYEPYIRDYNLKIILDNTEASNIIEYLDI